MHIGKSITELAQLSTFIHLCLSALDGATQATESLERARKVAAVLKVRDPFLSEQHYYKAKEHAVEAETFARAEAESGFPYLFSLAAIKIWTILECLVDEIVLECLKDLPRCSNIDLIRSLKGPLVEFIMAAPDDQAEYLANELGLAVRANLSPGVGRFENVLNPVGMGGSVADGVRRVLLEIGEVRNISVHRNGIADRRFVNSCPWFRIKFGEPVNLSHEDFHLYHIAATSYVVELDLRFDRRAGGPIDNDEVELKDSLIKDLELGLVQRRGQGLTPTS